MQPLDLTRHVSGFKSHMRLTASAGGSVDTGRVHLHRKFSRAVRQKHSHKWAGKGNVG